MLGNILGSVASSIFGGNNNQSTAIQLIQALLQSQGGVEGLIAKFQQTDLSDLLKSWISEDKNEPISGSQITEVLGQDTIEIAAKEAGMENAEASDLLAEYLPKIVNAITPNGELPDLKNLNVNDLVAQAAKGMLNNLFK